MLGLRFLLLSNVLGLSFLLNQAYAAPQDVKTMALLAAGQVKDVIENGAAAKDHKTMEVFGIGKVSTGMEIGFGDAMKQKSKHDDDDDDDRRRKRAAADAPMISTNLLANIEESGLSAGNSNAFKQNAENEQRNKRDADSDSSSSSSSSSDYSTSDELDE